jgi:hypothetical protein
MIRRAKSYQHWVGFKSLDVQPLQEISYAYGSSYSEGEKLLQRVRDGRGVGNQVDGVDGGKT